MCFIYVDTCPFKHLIRGGYSQHENTAQEAQATEKDQEANRRRYKEIVLRELWPSMERTTNSATVAHERLASISQFDCTLLESRVFVRKSGMQGFVQIHLGAVKTHACQKGTFGSYQRRRDKKPIESHENRQKRTSYGP